MEMGIMLLVAVVVLLGVWLAYRSSRWKILQTATGSSAAELEVKYEHLKSNHIKCVLETDAGPAAHAGIAQGDLMPNHSGSVVKLKVHKAQFEQAKELLEEFPEAI